MKHWTEGPLIGFDTETTGADPKTARIIQAAFIDDQLEYVALMNPDIPIPEEATKVHGITNEMLSDASPSATEIRILHCQFTRKAKDVPVVIFNCCYDWPLLLNACARISVEFDFKPLFLDPLVIDRALDKYRKGGRKLDDLARHYEVTMDKAHDAGSDARAAIKILQKQIEIFPALKTYSIEQMQDMQARWFESWRDNINQYWERTGKADRVNGTWPGVK